MTTQTPAVSYRPIQWLNLNFESCIFSDVQLSTRCYFFVSLVRFFVLFLSQDKSGEVRVRTIHSPLHWTREQVPQPEVPAAVAMEPEHVPYEAEEVAQEEKPAALGDGETVSCEPAASCETAVSCEPAVSCETAVSCEPQREGQEE